MLANAGGVVVSYFEWVHNLQRFQLGRAAGQRPPRHDHAPRVSRVAARAERDATSLRVAAFELGLGRVLEAARTRGYIERPERRSAPTA